MRVAKKEPSTGPQPDLTPFQCGQEAFQRGMRLDVGLRHYGCVTRDQSASFARGYTQEHADAVESVTGDVIDIEDPKWHGVSPY